MTKEEKAIEQTIERLYLDYFKYFVSIEKFAEHYGLSKTGAELIIKEGRKINRGKNGL